MKIIAKLTELVSFAKLQVKFSLEISDGDVFYTLMHSTRDFERFWGVLIEAPIPISWTINDIMLGGWLGVGNLTKPDSVGGSKQLFSAWHQYAMAL